MLVYFGISQWRWREGCNIPQKMSMALTAPFRENGFSHKRKGVETMDNSDYLAAFRYGLIASVVSRQTPFLPGEIKTLLEEIASNHYTIPESTRTRVSIRSLERYVSDYRKHGWDGLKPRERAPRHPSMPRSVLEMAVELRKSRPERSVEQISNTRCTCRILQTLRNAARLFSSSFLMTTAASSSTGSSTGMNVYHG